MPERMSAQEYNRKFREYFPDLGDPRTFYDTLLITVSGTPRIDVIALDEAIGTPDGTSTADYITQRYGPAATAFVRSLI